MRPSFKGKRLWWYSVRRGLFKFEDYCWLYKSECKKMVEKTWCQQVVGSSSFNFVSRLKSVLKQKPKPWKKGRRVPRKQKTDKISFGDGDPMSVKGLASYFADLFTYKGPNPEHVLNWHGWDYLSNILSEKNRCNLDRPFTEDEVKKALFEMDPWKSPGPDGIPGAFYQLYWKIIGTSITNVVHSFLNYGFVPKEVNYTLIRLIPKTDEPRTPDDFRPISLTNVLYRIIARVLANRLKTVLNDLISPHQNAFIPGRLISDNVLLVNELIHFIKGERKGIVHYAALKVDMSKAFDRVNWFFLFEALRRMGFSQQWISLLKQCVMTPSFAVSLKGTTSQPFQASQGLRQGDPLSPFLFLLYLEPLSAVLSNLERLNLCQGIKLSRRSKPVSHLLFADDCMFFFRSSVSSCEALNSALADFCNVSGQVINLSKSFIFFSPSVDAVLQDKLRNIFKVESNTDPWKYLGLPICVSRNREEPFQQVLDKFDQKLRKMGSENGQGEQQGCIARSVLALPIYAFTTFKVPLSICSEMDTVMLRFWRQNGEGGLGFRSFADFNIALLAKSCWRLLNQPDCLMAQVLLPKYCARVNLMHLPSLGAGSWAWRSLLHGRELLRRGLFWQIGNGRSVSFFRDIWVPGLGSALDVSGNPIYRVSDFIEIEGNRQIWKQDLLKSMVPQQFFWLIISMGLPPIGHSDKPLWKWREDRAYTVRSGLNLLRHRNLGTRSGKFQHTQRPANLFVHNVKKS